MFSYHLIKLSKKKVKRSHVKMNNFIKSFDKIDAWNSYRTHLVAQEIQNEGC